MTGTLMVNCQIAVSESVPKCNVITVFKLNKQQLQASVILFEMPVDGTAVQNAQKIHEEEAGGGGIKNERVLGDCRLKNCMNLNSSGNCLHYRYS
jgi:hypothetical protein